MYFGQDKEGGAPPAPVLFRAVLRARKMAMRKAEKEEGAPVELY